MKRSNSNKLIFGVCAGLAQEFNIDPIIVRAGFTIVTLAGFGTPILIYIVLAIVMPPEGEV